MATKKYISVNAENLIFELLTGAAANTNIAIANIKTTDELKMVVESDVSAGTLTDRLSTTTITSDGNIQCTADTATDKLIVIWRKKTVDA